VFVAGKGCGLLGNEGIAEGALLEREHVQRDRYEDIRLAGVEAIPDVSVAENPQVPAAGSFLVEADGLGNGLQHLVVGVRSTGLGVQSQGDHIRVDLLKQLQHGGHIPGDRRFLCEDFAGVEAQAQVAYRFTAPAEIAPEAVRLPLPAHPLQPLDVGQVLLPRVLGFEIADQLFDSVLEALAILLFVQFHHVSVQPSHLPVVLHGAGA
jgi:hypothetical protein